MSNPLFPNSEDFWPVNSNGRLKNGAYYAVGGVVELIAVVDVFAGGSPLRTIAEYAAGSLILLATLDNKSA